MKKILEIIIEFFKSLFGKKTDVKANTNKSVSTNKNSGGSGGGGTVESDKNRNVPESSERRNDLNERQNTLREFADESLMASPSNSPVSSVKILVDNGHGNNTKGKRSPYSTCGVAPEIEFYEYKWNREIAQPIVKHLKEMGYDAELLVPEEKDISLKERVKRVNNICSEYGKNNVIVISIHSNAAGDGSKWMGGRGWSAYTSKGNTKSDILAEYLYKAAENYFVDKKIRRDMSDGDSDEEANFYILKNTLCPAVLTENFFYDNVDDVKYILSDEGKEDVINAHIDGIREYLKSI